MEEAPTYLLAPLASLEEQRRYIVGGTKDEYLVPDELVHDALRFCEHFEKADRLTTLELNERDTLDRLRKALDAFGRVPHLYNYASISDLIEKDKGWAVMRARAREALEVFKPNAA